jgi:hypothetical protein
MFNFHPRVQEFILFTEYTDALLALKYGHHAILSFLKGSEGCCTVHVGRMERTVNLESYSPTCMRRVVVQPTVKTIRNKKY